MTAISWERLEIHSLPFVDKVPHGFWEGRVRETEHPEFSSVFVLPNRDEAARFAAEKIVDLVKAKPDAAITWPSGRQGNDVIDKVVSISRERGIPLDGIHVFHLDEYFPISDTDPESFRYNLRKRLVEPLGIPEDHFHQISADPGTDGMEVARRYEELLKQTEMDLVLHPIGCGGHVGFSEKGTPLESETHLQQLSEETVRRDHEERHLNTPEQAITQGIRSVLRAKRILFIDFDPAYASSMNDAMYGPVGPDNPSSWLRTQGGNVDVIVTEDVASLLSPPAERPSRS